MDSVQVAIVVVGVVGLLVLTFWGGSILGALTSFHDWVGKKHEEQREKNKRADEEDE